jgi:hypothetical protein
MLKSNRKKLYFIVLPVLIIIIVVVAIIVFKNKTVKNNLAITNSQSLVLSSEVYQAKARDLFSRLSVDDPNNASQVKQELLNLKISKEFKDVHFRLVMLAASLEQYATTHDKTILKNIKNILNKLVIDYPWLTKTSS